MDSMRAIVQHEFGGPDVLRVESRAVPEPVATEVRVEADVAQRMMLGSRTQLHLRAGIGQAMPLIAEVAGDAPDLIPGARARFGFDMADLAWVDA